MNTEVAPLGPDRRGGAFPLAPYRLPPADGGLAPGGASGFDISTVVRILHDWRWLILGAIGIGAAIGLAATLLTKPMYRAWVTLEANPPTVEILDEKKREVQTEGSYDFIATQIGLLSSRSLAERVAQDLNLASDPAYVAPGGDPARRLSAATGKVAGGLTVITPESGQLIRYNYVDPSPQMAAKVANGIAESFISSGLQRKLEASAYARDFLQKQIAKTRASLETSERALVAYAQAQGIINTGTTDTANSGGDVSSLQGASLVALNSALAEATARRIQAQGAYQQAQMAGGSSEVTASTSALRQSKAALEAQYSEKRTLMKPDHPDMLALRSQIDELDRQISRERAQVTGGQVNSLLAAYRAAAAAENNLRGQVSGLKGSVLNLRGRSIQYNILQRDVDTNRGLYDALLQRYKEIGVGGGVGNSPVMIVDRAEPPGGPYKPNLLFNLLLGLVAGMLAGIGTAFALEYVNDTIKTREDVKAKLALACLGVVPKSTGKGRLIDEFEDPSSPVSEAYSAI
ncbi:MAG: GumC family protein, partial [Sphingomicrobium sp.]